MEWQKKTIAFLRSQRVEVLFRWGLGLLFLFSSYHKITDPRGFGKVLLGYELFPFSFIVFSANVFPFVEAICGISLILGIFPRESAVIIAGMLTFFILVLSFNLIRGIEHDCGCFSSEQSGSPFPLWLIIIRNTFLLIAALFVLAFEGKRIACWTQK